MFCLSVLRNCQAGYSLNDVMTIVIISVEGRFHNNNNNYYYYYYNNARQQHNYYFQFCLAQDTAIFVAQQQVFVFQFLIITLNYEYRLGAETA
jgi:hypothetical protein